MADFIVKDANTLAVASKTYTYGTADNVRVTFYNADETNTVDIALTEVSGGKVHSLTLGTALQINQLVFPPLASVTITNTNTVNFTYIAELQV